MTREPGARPTAPAPHSGAAAAPDPAATPEAGAAAASSARATDSPRRSPPSSARASRQARAPAASRSARWRRCPSRPIARRRPAAPPALVEVTRGGRVESVHRGSVAVVAPDGSLVASVGDPDQFAFTRSSAKPFQLAPFVASGRFDEYGFRDRCAGDHGRQPLGRGSPRPPRPGGPAPRRPDERRPPEPGPRPVRHRDGAAPARGMARSRPCCATTAPASTPGWSCFAKASGWPLETYWQPEHPVQRSPSRRSPRSATCRSRRSPPPRMAVASCASACRCAGSRLAYARLADPSAVADPPLRSALTRIRDAMMEHPELVAGERRRIDTALMRAYPKRIVSKGGAEGVQAIGLPPGGPSANGAIRRRTDGHRVEDRGRQPGAARRRCRDDRYPASAGPRHGSTRRPAGRICRPTDRRSPRRERRRRPGRLPPVLTVRVSSRPPGSHRPVGGRAGRG